MKKSIFNYFVFSLIALSAAPFVAADKTISVVSGCETIAGSTNESNGGLQASGGTAIVRCPILKDNGSISTLWARVENASSSGANSFCTAVATNAWGGTSFLNTSFNNGVTGTQSVNMSLPTQASTGYLHMFCTLVVNDKFFGIRYLQ